MRRSLGFPSTQTTIADSSRIVPHVIDVVRMLHSSEDASAEATPKYASCITWCIALPSRHSASATLSQTAWP
jgi:hypothetical protein